MSEGAGERGGRRGVRAPLGQGLRGLGVGPGLGRKAPSPLRSTAPPWCSGPARRPPSTMSQRRIVEAGGRALAVPDQYRRSGGVRGDRRGGHRGVRWCRRTRQQRLSASTPSRVSKRSTSTGAQDHGDQFVRLAPNDEGSGARHASAWGGSVVMVASMVARRPQPLQGGYAISKGALLTATRRARPSNWAQPESG